MFNDLVANERIRPNDGHAQRKCQASHALACGTTVSDECGVFLGAANQYLFQSQRNWRKVLNTKLAIDRASIYSLS